MNPQHDDIDALLRQSFDGPTPDAGFCDRVMQRLPSRRRRPSAWPHVAGVLVGAVMCSLSLFNPVLWSSVWHDWLVGEWSGSTIILLSTMAGMSLLALSWTLVEVDE